MTVHHRVVPEDEAPSMEEVHSVPKKPIRIGIIGLSTKPGAWATLAHLPRLAISPNYKIVALCNSTLESTKAAIKAHNLPADTKAYDTYEGLASDPDVDLYVVSTRADTHYDCALPALKAGGKDIYVEWPLASNMREAEELVNMAKASGIRTIIGLQGRISPSVLKVREIVDSGRLGDIHSVNYQGWINVWQNNAASRRYHYFMDRKIGGNLLTIYGGHILDSIFFALGELKNNKAEKVLAGNMRKKMKVLEDDGSLTNEEFEKDTPDQMMLMGRLERKGQSVDPMFCFHLRAGARFIDGPGSEWRIYGTKGELVMNFASAGPQIAGATSIKISDFEKGVVEEVKVDEGGNEWTGLAVPGQNIGRLYEAYAEGKEYGDWELALKRHELIEQFYDNME